MTISLARTARSSRRPLVRLHAAALVLIALGARAGAEGTPSSAPVLRLEAGVHSARINRIGADADGRWLVTASHDGTARVWDLRSGAQVRVLRPPLGDGRKGRPLNAVAISADGRLVAAGGWTGLATAGDDSVYVFDRATGHLLRRMGGFPEVMSHVALSPDGQWLAVAYAATLGGSHGVRVFRTSDFALVGHDTDFRSEPDVEVAGDGRFVATTQDGLVRLYRVSSSGLASVAPILNIARSSASGRAALGAWASPKNPGGKRLSTAVFSPDGRRIAVGYFGSPRVQVLDGRTAAHRYDADTSGLAGSFTAAIAWSHDGKMLYAAGDSGKDGGALIRTWADAGRGAFHDAVVAESTVTSLRALPGGDLAFGAADPAWGVLEASGKRRLFVGPPIVDFRDGEASFAVSADGAEVRFGYERYARSPARFDARARILTLGGDAAGLVAPRKAWRDPKLSSAGWMRPGSTWPYAIAPGDERVFTRTQSLFGSMREDTGWFVSVVDVAGDKTEWAQPAPAAVWSVNVSGDGHLAVAAYGDGTIRWYRMSDGKELLALFPHADRRRWVLWTPSGYYDASPGGEDLIGWHVNRGPDREADFFPASRFRDTFYRPDVVSRVLDTLDEGHALRLADAEASRWTALASVAERLPPVVEILSPGDGATFSGEQVPVKFRVRSPAGAPARALRVRVNGRNVPVAKAGDLVSGSEKGVELRVQVPCEQTEIQVFVENQHAWSAPATVRLTCSGTPAAVRKPVLYVLAVGVSGYRSQELPDLSYAHKDAQDFEAALKRQEGALYGKVHVRLLENDKATRQEILSGLSWLRREVTQQDVGMVFFSGHGDVDADGRYYFLPVDVDPNELLATAVPKEDIKLTLASLAGKAVLFMDSCHAGSVAQHGRKGAADLVRIVNELNSAENGMAVYASSTGRQSSLEDDAWRNGAFTKALVEGLSGKAADATGRITHQALGVYLSDRVKELTRGRQQPVAGNDGVADFPIATAPR